MKKRRRSNNKGQTTLAYIIFIIVLIGAFAAMIPKFARSFNRHTKIPRILLVKAGSLVLFQLPAGPKTLNILNCRMTAPEVKLKIRTLKKLIVTPARFFFIFGGSGKTTGINVFI
jgi:hypothetical protein